MIKKILLAIMVMASVNAHSQRSAADIEADFRNFFFARMNIPVSNWSTAADAIKAYLLEMEHPTEFNADISADTRRLISNVGTIYAPSAVNNHLYVLVLLERSIREDNSISLHMKDKLVKAVSHQIKLMQTEEYGYYGYDTKEKQILKFVSIRTGNDLLTLAGLFSNFFMPADKHVGDNHVFFQRNDDRDYTGSFLLELGTDYLNTRRKRPLKTYQTILYGFDVYTPYFKDPVIFKDDNSYNPKDRPHASFQYVGWSKKCLSKENKMRWSTTIKVGKIGGKIGERFQNAIHQDISYSPRPKGWRAQIADGGRIGISAEGREEFFQKEFLPQSWYGPFYLSGFSEQKLGTYMTNASVGLRLSNKSFKQNNMNFIDNRTHFSASNLKQHFMYNVSFYTTYVLHNTMLEGYGVFTSKEKVADAATPKSYHYLDHDVVRRVNFTFNTTVSYTTIYGTFFYNWYSFSPETRLTKIGIVSTASGKEMDIRKRWHHFAELGLSFNLH